MGSRTANASLFRDRFVVLVDDDSALRESLQGLLESAYLRVLAFGTAQEALETLGHKPIGCLITDVRMERMDGWQLQKLATRLYPHLPVIVITAYPDGRESGSAANSEAFAFFDKPLDGELLLETVLLALERGASSTPPNS